MNQDKSRDCYSKGTQDCKHTANLVSVFPLGPVCLLVFRWPSAAQRATPTEIQWNITLQVTRGSSFAKTNSDVILCRWLELVEGPQLVRWLSSRLQQSRALQTKNGQQAGNMKEERQTVLDGE